MVFDGYLLPSRDMNKCLERWIKLYLLLIILLHPYISQWETGCGFARASRRKEYTYEYHNHSQFALFSDLICHWTRGAIILCCLRTGLDWHDKISEVQDNWSHMERSPIENLITSPAQLKFLHITLAWEWEARLVCTIRLQIKSVGKFWNFCTRNYRIVSTKGKMNNNEQQSTIIPFRFTLSACRTYQTTYIGTKRCHQMTLRLTPGGSWARFECSNN